MLVFVLDTNKKPLDPTHPARARRLLRAGRASVFRRYPFTIILHDSEVEDSHTSEYRLKIDPIANLSALEITLVKLYFPKFKRPSQRQLR
ncbi:MAG TPA: hypothetical protein DCE56_31410 [Cyanobacteria bacterium UBA8553]|nr:hypothetical protein [Cyanobacteria bacterium UBA8553]HAJ61332.1 hypothetical protein [Cyanobacteria bacterium UBA8543]